MLKKVHKRMDGVKRGLNSGFCDICIEKIGKKDETNTSTFLEKAGLC